MKVILSKNYHKKSNPTFLFLKIMIAQLTGNLSHKTATEIIVDVHGVGYSVHIPLSTYEKLGALQTSVKLFIHHHIREDAQVLYGFLTEDEREIFRLLISVSGIGPKSAQTILSGIQPKDLQQYILDGNSSAITAIPGVGKKTAERLVVELKDKFAKMETTFTNVSPTTKNNIRSEALLALLSLGYTREKAEQSIRIVLNELNGKDIAIEDLIKRVLKVSGK